VSKLRERTVIFTEHKFQNLSLLTKERAYKRTKIRLSEMRIYLENRGETRMKIVKSKKRIFNEVTGKYYYIYERKAEPGDKPIRGLWHKKEK
jgi:glycosyltransferase involved in cell wall biosynthesis